MKLNILTPESSIFEGEVDSLVIPGAKGLFGILNNHAPILSSVAPGPLKLKQGDSEKLFHIGGGFIEFNSNNATVLADSIEEPGKIDIKRVDEAIKRAKARLKERKNVEIERAERALLRALSRRKVFSSHN